VGEQRVGDGVGLDRDDERPEHADGADLAGEQVDHAEGDRGLSDLPLR
jgi:hypothetical protein